jgi:hypothetical protein
MFNRFIGLLIIIAAALLIVWMYNINQLLQYEICSSQPVTELSQKCKEILNVTP